MSYLFTFMNVALVCGTLLGLAFMIVLSLPQSRMRDVVQKVLLAIGCVLYVLSPVDIMPEVVLGPLGLIDDLGALIAGIISARQAMHMVSK